MCLSRTDRWRHPFLFLFFFKCILCMDKKTCHEHVYLCMDQHTCEAMQTSNLQVSWPFAVRNWHQEGSLILGGRARKDNLIPWLHLSYITDQLTRQLKDSAQISLLLGLTFDSIKANIPCTGVCHVMPCITSRTKQSTCHQRWPQPKSARTRWEDLDLCEPLCEAVSTPILLRILNHLLG